MQRRTGQSAARGGAADLVSGAPSERSATRLPAAAVADTSLGVLCSATWLQLACAWGAGRPAQAAKKRNARLGRADAAAAARSCDRVRRMSRTRQVRLRALLREPLSLREAMCRSDCAKSAPTDTATGAAVRAMPSRNASCCAPSGVLCRGPCRERPAGLNPFRGGRELFFGYQE